MRRAAVVQRRRAARDHRRCARRPGVRCAASARRHGAAARARRGRDRRAGLGARRADRRAGDRRDRVARPRRAVRSGVVRAVRCARGGARGAAARAVRRRDRCAVMTPGRRWLALIAVGAALVVAPLVLGTYGSLTLARMLVFALFAASLDLLVGVTGLPSLGHGAYFGAGAYAAGWVAIHVTRSAPATLAAPGAARALCR